MLGEITEHPEAWEEATPINLIPQLGNGDLAIVFDCGYDDFFFEVNNDFHDELLRRGIMHDFYVRPGGHTGAPIGTGSSGAAAQPGYAVRVWLYTFKAVF